VIVFGGWGSAVVITSQYRFLAVLASIILLVIFTLRGASLMWRQEVERADDAEAAFRPGGLTAVAHPMIRHAETVIVNQVTLSPGAEIPPELTGGTTILGDDPTGPREQDAERDGPDDSNEERSPN
jgi:hypothetical protein